MLLTTPRYPPDFLRENNIGVEFEIGRDDLRPDWPEFRPLARSIHLPYSKLNFAAVDDAVRCSSIRTACAAVRAGARYGIHDMVLHPCGVASNAGVMVGTYERLIDSLREIADCAARYKVIISLENHVLRSPLQMTRFGSSANDWYRIFFDLDRSNVRLTFDVSHAASAVAVYPDPRERCRRLHDFLAHPEFISRVHWSDSCLGSRKADFTDFHLTPGAGDLPKAFHRKIKRLHAIKVLEIKHRSPDAMPDNDVKVDPLTPDDLKNALDFIRSL